eukprot:c17819_g1_i1 orf=532-999(+)
MEKLQGWRVQRDFFLYLVVLQVFVVYHQQVIASREVDALHAFRQAVYDPNNVLDSWDPTLVDPCTWFHVTCNQNKVVTRIDLPRSALSGALVPELADLKFLQYLELYNNNFSGSIPGELGRLTQLLSLDLFGNSLTGVIPAQLGELNNLRFLCGI